MRASLPFLLLLLAALALAACSDDDAGSGSGGNGSSTVALQHVDGTLQVEGEQFVVTDAAGEELTFTYGPEVEPAEVRALEAAGNDVRVTYRPAEGPPVAAAVTEKPSHEGLETYEGAVLSIDDQELVMSGPDGERTFSIADAGPANFDVDHLQQHKERAEPITVYFDPKSPDVGIAYEDA